jgi:ribosome biogenesis GTPase
MKGKIIRGVGGFYYVQDMAEDTWSRSETVTYECHARGVFRNEKIRPLVGDEVEIDLLTDQTGTIEKIYPRRNLLIRPSVTNVDQAAVVFALTFPKPNLNLLDRFLLMMEVQKIPSLICFNKLDMAEDDVADQLLQHYQNSGYPVFMFSAKTGDGMEKFFQALGGKTTVLAGPSGVGKSTVMNQLFPQAAMETGNISEKIKRGKNTTRYSELFCIQKNTYLMDTPGFTSLRLPDIECGQLQAFYPEFFNYQKQCRFLGCVHIHEPDCAVKDALKRNEISDSRYRNYLQFFEEMKQQQRK